MAVKEQIFVFGFKKKKTEVFIIEIYSKVESLSSNSTEKLRRFQQADFLAKIATLIIEKTQLNDWLIMKRMLFS